jgi:DNA polymerase sigma
MSSSWCIGIQKKKSVAGRNDKTEDPSIDAPSLHQRARLRWYHVPETEFIDYVSEQMMDYYARVRMTRVHKSQIKSVMQRLERDLADSLPGAQFSITLFGSAASGLGTVTSDLDLRIECTSIISKRKLHNMANDLSRKSYRIKNVIAHARVPIIKFSEPLL